MSRNNLLDEADQLARKMTAELGNLTAHLSHGNDRTQAFESFVIGKLAVLQVGLQDHLRRIKDLEGNLNR
jgi:hypothetical protein